MNIPQTIKRQLQEYADRYEVADFIIGDPSYFMHQVSGVENQETTAFVAQALSYGSRKQFMPKIESLLQASGGDMYNWIKSGKFNSVIKANNHTCFYRLYTNADMNAFLTSCRLLLNEHGSIGNYVRQNAQTGFEAIDCLCRFFAKHGSGGIIPKDTTSCCKRIAMFLRWMVRTGSPVDLGLWTFISPSTLIMPLDTHVLTEAQSLSLISSRTASMSAAKRLTATLAEVFSDDPLKADFALFGYGVTKQMESKLQTITTQE